MGAQLREQGVCASIRGSDILIEAVNVVWGSVMQTGGLRVVQDPGCVK